MVKKLSEVIRISKTRIRSIQSGNNYNLMEKKIIEKVYKLERKSIIFTFVKYLVLVFFSLTFVIILSSVILKILSEQQTLSLLEIFREDLEIIKEFLPDTWDILYIELPKEQILFLVFFCLLLFVTIFAFAKNYSKIKNRFHSLYKYFQRARP